MDRWTVEEVDGWIENRGSGWMGGWMDSRGNYMMIIRQINRNS